MLLLRKLRVASAGTISTKPSSPVVFISEKNKIFFTNKKLFLFRHLVRALKMWGTGPRILIKNFN